MSKINKLRVLSVVTALACMGVNEMFLVDGDDYEKLILFFAMVTALTNLQLTFTARDMYKES